MTAYVTIRISVSARQPESKQVGSILKSYRRCYFVVEGYGSWFLNSLRNDRKLGIGAFSFGEEQRGKPFGCLKAKMGWQ